jgi:putative peptidoglycan lipid II flippase
MQNTNDSTKGSFFLSVIKMAFATFTSRVLGLIRELFFAKYFGASGLTDAFIVAYRIPNLLRDLLAEGAFSSAFVPTFTEKFIQNKEKAKELLWSLFAILSLITIGIGFLYAYFAPELIELFAPKFLEDTEKYQLSINLLRIMSPFLFCVSIAALFMGVLNTLRIFFIPSIAPASANVFMILAMIFFVPLFQYWGINSIYSLGIGVLLGGFSQIFLQVPSLIKSGFGFIWPKVFITKEVKKILILIGPGLIGLTATQLNLIVTTHLASSIEGAVSWMNYAFRLFQFPVGILSVSIAGSTLVHFSDFWKRGQRREAQEILQSSYLFSWFTLIPSTILLIVFSPHIIHILLERGLFTFQDTLQTSLCLKIYALGLPFYGLYKVFVPIYYSVDQQKYPVYFSLISVTLNVIFCTLLFNRYGYTLLPLGTTLSMGLNCLLLMVFSRRFVDINWDFFLNLRFFKIFLSGTLMGIGIYLSESYFLNIDLFLYMTLTRKILLTFLISSLGILLYLQLLWIFGEGELIKKQLLLRRKKRN